MKTQIKAYWIIFSHWFKQKYFRIRYGQIEIDFIHNQFGLSYASWMVMPRVLMCEMPNDWQKDMVRLWDEFNEMWDMDLLYKHGEPFVQLRKGGKFISIEKTGLPHYRHPQRGGIEHFRKLYIDEV